MLPISERPSAHRAAMSIAIPARMSGDSRRSPRSCEGPVMIARCGSHIVMSAPISTSLSVKIMRFSNIHSWMSAEPEHCVASATAIEVRSAGKAGHGPSWTLILCSPTSREMTRSWPPGTTTSAPSSSERRPRRSKTRRIMRRSLGIVSRMRSSPPVTPASAMNDPISMWSGPIVWSQPWRPAVPLTVRTLEPMPWMSAPIFTSIRARSWTCGSQAALPITVEPGVRAAASRAFSVAMTDGSSMKTSPARRPPGARSSMSRPCSNVAPSAAKASRCGSRRRRPMTSPPGGGMRTRPTRASSGPASRNDARMRSDRSRSMTASSVETSAAQSATSWSDSHVTRTPRSSRSASIAPTSLIFGTFRTTTSSSVRTEAARIGSAPFLLPAGTIVPDRAMPPSMTNFSIGRRLPATGAEPKGWARVTAMSSRISRTEAWSLLTDWVQSESLRRHCMAVEAAMAAFAERDGEDAELWGVTGLLHDADYERFPDMDDAEQGHPRTIMAELQRRDAPPEMVRAIAAHADYLGVPPQSPMERTLVAVDELCGFLVACAYVRPEGIPGLTPKAVKKKLKQPSFAAAVNREEIHHNVEDLGVDLDEHIRFMVAALEERADELELHGTSAAASPAAEAAAARSDAAAQAPAARSDAAATGAAPPP